MIVLIAICLPLLSFVLAFTIAGILFQVVPEGGRRRRPDPMTYMIAALVLLGALAIEGTPILTPLWLQYLLFVLVPAAIGVGLGRFLSRR